MSLFRAYAFPALVLAVASVAGARPTAFADVPRPTLAPFPALSAFHQALSELQGGKRTRVTVVLFGDSHTQGDRFSGALRDLLQERFGNAGRGMLPPGKPDDDWYPLGLKVAQRGHWKSSTSNKTNFDPVPYGMSGFMIRSTRAGSSISLEAGSKSTFDSVDIGYYRQPDGGRVEVLADGELIGEIDTSGPGYALTHAHLATHARARTLEVRAATDRPVDIANWSIDRNDPGVVLTSHGFSGAQVGIMDRWDWHNVTDELRALNPSLVLVAFGTNEGYAPLAQLESYAETYEQRLRALQRVLPDASIVAVGAPDANDLPRYCGIGAQKAEQMPCRPLDADEAERYDELLGAKDGRLCRWHTPPHIAYVRALQREITRRLGILFWDWGGVEGGSCGATRWAEQGLAHKDRVHLRQEGAQISAERLVEVLLRGYDGS